MLGLHFAELLERSFDDFGFFYYGVDLFLIEAKCSCETPLHIVERRESDKCVARSDVEVNVWQRLNTVVSNVGAYDTATLH